MIKIAPKIHTRQTQSELNIFIVEILTQFYKTLYGKIFVYLTASLGSLHDISGFILLGTCTFVLSVLDFYFSDHMKTKFKQW